ncbi:MAG: DNA replication and repair protein RecF [Prevotella sp.]|nr:DNA replication and repair protein RecF [Prevotella sp.]
MHLDKISIVNYKNLAEVSLMLSPNINCLIGNNGEGKTNFVDAVYYLSFCRSAFYHLDSQIIRHGQDFFMLEGTYSDDDGGGEVISCGMKSGKKKHVCRNRKEYRRLSEHLGLIPIIMVSPSDIALIEGASEERRKLMDATIAQYNREYIDALSRYNKALQQRNHILKDDNPDISVLEIYEEEMAQQGEILYKHRCEFVEEVEPFFQNLYSHISGDKEHVELHYISHCQRGVLLDVIRRDRQKDIVVGYSLHGVHRDDLEMTLSGYPMRREGSQGQNKTYALALKLAQFELLCRRNGGRTPILLLDDIFDKLDAQRVEQIVTLVSGKRFGQIFITDTNRDHLDSILRCIDSDYKLFCVRNGDVEIINQNQ